MPKYENLTVVIEPYLFDNDQIKTIEKTKKAKYVCCIEYMNTICELFYSDEPHPVSQTRYFVLYTSKSKLMIGNGGPLDGSEISAYLTDNKIVYSRFNHDFKQHGNITVDGGPVYSRVLYEEGNLPKSVTLKIIDGKLIPIKIY